MDRLYLSGSRPYLTITAIYGWYSPFAMDSPDVNLWRSAEHVLDYLAKADTLPHRTEGEAELLACLPPPVSRVLDLGSGDGRLLALVKLARANASAIALDFSPTMIEQLEARFARDPSVQVVVHDLDNPLPASLGTFDAIVCSLSAPHTMTTGSVGHRSRTCRSNHKWRPASHSRSYQSVRLTVPAGC